MCLSVCLCVNHGGTYHNRSIQTCNPACSDLLTNSDHTPKMERVILPYPKQTAVVVGTLTPFTLQRCTSCTDTDRGWYVCCRWRRLCPSHSRPRCRHHRRVMKQHLMKRRRSFRTTSSDPRTRELTIRQPRKTHQRMPPPRIKLSLPRRKAKVRYSSLNNWRLGMRRSSNLRTFELRMFLTDSKFDKCFKRFVVECKFVKKSFYDWFHMHREPESADKPVFFSNSTYRTNYSYWMCNIIVAQWSVTLY